MQINGASFGAAISRPSGGGGRRAVIEKQIKKLEERRQELVEKLANMAKSQAGSGSASDGISGGTFSSSSASEAFKSAVATSQSGGTMPRVMSGDTGDDSASGAAAAMAPAPTPAVPAPEPIKPLRLQAPEKKTGQSQAMDPADFLDDPKEIAKMIMAIDMQIMALRQQLQDEGLMDNVTEALSPEPTDPKEALQSLVAEGGRVYQNEYGDEAIISGAAAALSAQSAAAVSGGTVASASTTE